MNRIYTLLIISIFASFNAFAQYPDWSRINYETSSVFTGVVTVDGRLGSINDRVGVFVDGECRMVTRVIHVNDSSFVSAVVHVDNANEIATIRYFHAESGETYELDTAFTVKSHGSIKRFPIQIKSDEEPSAIPDVVDSYVDVYPSPFKDVININTSKEIKDVAIYNSIGNVMTSLPNVNESSTIIPTSEFSVGLYLVSIEFHDGSVVTKKVVKK